MAGCERDLIPAIFNIPTNFFLIEDHSQVWSCPGVITPYPTVQNLNEIPADIVVLEKEERACAIINVECIDVQALEKEEKFEHRDQTLDVQN